MLVVGNFSPAALASVMLTQTSHRVDVGRHHHELSIANICDTHRDDRGEVTDN